MSVFVAYKIDEDGNDVLGSKMIINKKGGYESLAEMIQWFPDFEEGFLYSIFNMDVGFNDDQMGFEGFHFTAPYMEMIGRANLYLEKNAKYGWGR